jgi:hypothetical protein
MKMQLGFTIKPDISVERIVGLTGSAEAAGFEYGWMFVSHILWKEPFKTFGSGFSVAAIMGRSSLLVSAALPARRVRATSS